MAQPASAAITRAVGLVRTVFSQLPVECRPIVAQFWQDVRDIILRLEDDLQRATAGPPAPRPTTSDSVDQVRQAISDELVRQSVTLPDTGSTIDEIYALDPAWVEGKLRSLRNQQRPALGCWETNIHSGHPSGYKRVNWRNTKIPGSRHNFSGMPYLHQLAVVADGNGVLLLRTAREWDDPDVYEVSHLCHNTGCFNPQHVVVESQGLNGRRKQCSTAVIVVHPDGTVYHPCPHGAEEGRHTCLLPRRDLVPRTYNIWRPR